MNWSFGVWVIPFRWRLEAHRYLTLDCAHVQVGPFCFAIDWGGNK